jgi:hypothetical protein
MMSTATVNKTGNAAPSTDIEKTAPHNQPGNVVPRENSSNGIGASIESDPQASKAEKLQLSLAEKNGAGHVQLRFVHL